MAKKKANDSIDSANEKENNSQFNKDKEISSPDSLIDNDLQDFDAQEHWFLKTKLDPEEILTRLDQIQIPEEVVTGLQRFCDLPNTKKVLSLTGGGAQGIVGNALYLYLLEKLQLLPYFDEIWGVSAGSIVGGGYASGMSVANIIRFAVKVKNRDLLELSVVEKIKKRTGSEKEGKPANNKKANLMGLLRNFKTNGIFGTSKIYHLLDELLRHKTFADAQKPFFCLATAFDGESEYIERFDQGPLVDAVVASMSVPDIFEPSVINQKPYVDGGLIENSPKRFSCSASSRARRSSRISHFNQLV